MAGVKISAIAADSSVTGVELIPVSDAGVAKSVTVTQIKNFTIDQIEAIPTTDTAPLTDSAFILQGEELKPVLLSVIAESVINEIWNKTLDASLAGTDIIAINNGSTTDNTATLAVLASYIQSAIRAAVLNPATLDASGATAGADYFVIGQSGVAKSITLTSLTAAIYSGMAAYVAAVTASTVADADDKLYVLQNDVQKLMPLSQIKTYVTTGLVSGLDAIGSGIADADTIIVDDGGTGTNRKAAVTVLTTYLKTKMTADTLAANDDITTNDATTSLHGLMSKADKVKLDGITAGSGVTDATTVAAAGAVMEADTTTALMQFVIDEDTLASDVATKVPTQQSVKAYVDARIPQAVDGTLATGNNASVSPTKLVYNKTCSDSTGDDIITLNDGTVIGQILTIYLGTKSGTDNAVITPATAVSYTTITLGTALQIATLQWQGATVGWAILYTNGTVA